MRVRSCPARLRPPIRALGALAALSICLGGCAATRNAAPRNYIMGQRAEVGPLVYSVLEAEWDPNLGPSRLPAHRFVLVRLSVTNSGAEEVMIPATQLIAPNGRSYQELADGAGVADWLGSLRKLAPVETIHGRVLFDVPRSDYHLRVSSEALNPEDAVVALIEIPLRFENQPVEGVMDSR